MSLIDQFALSSVGMGFSPFPETGALATLKKLLILPAFFLHSLPGKIFAHCSLTTDSLTGLQLAMAFDTVTDKTQQPPATTGDGGSLYDQIMTGPPAAAAQDTTTKAGDVPPPPGSAPVATMDRTVAPPTGEVVTAPKASVPPPETAVAVTAKDGLVPAPNGDMPVPPDQTKVADNTTGAKDVPPPSAPNTDAPPGTATDVVPPAGPGAAPVVEGVEDKGNCNFKPDYEYKTEQGRAWKAESDVQRGKHIELNEKGRYQVQHGDCLETIAERNLKDAGLSANRQAIKAEVADIVAANKNRYPSLDCNNEFLRDGWTLTLPKHQQGDKGDPAFDSQYNTVPQKPAEKPLPPRAERPADRPVERPAGPPPAVEVLPPQRDTRGHNHRRFEGSGNVVIEHADTVNVFGRNDAPRAIPSSRPYYPEQDDRPVYVQPQPRFREPVVYSGDQDFDPRYEPRVQNRRPPIIIDARFGDRGGQWGGYQPDWRRQQPWMNDDCFGTGRNSGRWGGGDDCDWRNGGSRISLNFGNDMRRMMPHMGRSMPYYHGNRGGYRGGNGISVSFRI